MADGQRIVEFDENGNFLNEVVGFTLAIAVAVDTSGTLFALDGDAVIKIDPTGEIVATWGTVGFDEGQFMTPFGIAVDGSDHVYVADTGNHHIQKFDASNQFVAKWGSQGSADGQFQTRPIPIHP